MLTINGREVRPNKRYTLKCSDRLNIIESSYEPAYLSVHPSNDQLVRVVVNAPYQQQCIFLRHKTVGHEIVAAVGCKTNWYILLKGRPIILNHVYEIQTGTTSPGCKGIPEDQEAARFGILCISTILVTPLSQRLRSPVISPLVHSQH